MGAWYHSLQLRGATREEAVRAAETIADRFGAGPPAGGWTPVFPEEIYDARALEAYTAPIPAIYLWTADSDSWGAVVVSGRVLAAHDSARERADPGTLAAALRTAFNVDVSAADVAADLELDPDFAEEAMDRFARRLGVATALNSLRLIARGEADGLDAADVEMHGASEPSGPLEAHVYAWLRAMPPSLGTRLERVLTRARAALGGDAPAVTAIRRGDTAQEDVDLDAFLALADAGDLRSAMLSFGTFSVHYHAPAPDYQTFHLRGEGEPGEAHRELLILAGPGLDAYHAFVGAAPADADSPELRELVTWPPSGHLADWLSPELAQDCGGAQRLADALPEHEVSEPPEGGVLVVLPLAPRDAVTERGRALRRAFAAAVEECAA